MAITAIAVRAAPVGSLNSRRFMALFPVQDLEAGPYPDVSFVRKVRSVYTDVDMGRQSANLFGNHAGRIRLRSDGLGPFNKFGAGMNAEFGFYPFKYRSYGRVC